MLILSAIFALALALIHIGASRMKWLQLKPRSRWLSFAGGVAVAYVFVHLLPELEKWQQRFERERLAGFMDDHLYFVALAGLIAFYGLERAVKLHKSDPGKVEKYIFRLHIASFALYNALIGYLLCHPDIDSAEALIFFSVAMGFHFVVNDIGLLSHHKHAYLHRSRWIVSAAIIAGWAIGALTSVSETAIAVMFAFLAGGIVLNVLKEELPEERQSRFWAFLLGAAVYAAVLL